MEKPFWSTVVRESIVDAINAKAGGNESKAARMTGYPQRTVNHWINGKAVKAEDFFAFLEALGVDPVEFVGNQAMKLKVTEHAA